MFENKTRSFKARDAGGFALCEACFKKAYFEFGAFNPSSP